VVVEETRAAAPDLAYLEAGSLLLKGKSARAPIHILVGDGTVAGSAAFLALGAAHATAIEALRADQAIAEALGRCRELCEEIDPRLGGFYDLLAQRAADFRVTA
jgi:adenylate cyclase